ncbi:class I SAM-dependent methyltransferase [Sphingomonas sp. URHD0057]|uniref:class I SAM-dependent methyltransferase n=1 Tax=Sphingomonas sp. URHD0057 TaxID=1380389 RepID=UPI000B05BDC5|nr:SAM-dependent methyltransferase [Sphingomonas sp. URHD0057]
MTPLERALHARIRADGPITLDAYMAACNAYYYATRDPLGATGDFTTAPEISQMFGELVGAALADCWKRAGEPDDAIYVELGPGRGTLAADALRVLQHSGFAGDVHLIETSPILRDAQREIVGDVAWHETINALPPTPALIVANEFLDALPIRQHVGGTERRVGIVGGHLAFDRDGEIVETSPARDEAVEALAAHVIGHGGAALLIDYGHATSAPGDTLQAMREHRHAPVLESPGEQDLTAHVDFQAVARAAEDAGASVTELTSQGRWLRALGIEARAGALSQANPKRAEDVDAALHRLTAADEMGDLFKVIAIHSPAWPWPMGFA